MPTQGKTTLDTLSEKIEMTQMALGLFALPAVAVSRRKVGLRMMQGFYLWVPVLIMAAVGYQFDEHHLLEALAVLVLAAGTWQNYNRWKELERGELTHTRSVGMSPLMFLPYDKFLPERLANWITTKDRIHRFVDPVIVIAIGLLLMEMDRPLGFYVVFTGFALRVFEEFKFQRQLTRIFDDIDMMLDADTQNEIMQYLKNGGNQALRDVSSRQSVVNEDVHLAQIAARQREAEAKAQERERRAAEAEAKAQERERRAAEAEAQRRQHQAEQEAARPAPEKETLIIMASDKETIYEKETVVIMSESKEKETVKIVIVPVSEQPEAIEAEPFTEAILSEVPTLELVEDAAPPALPSPQHQLQAPPDEADEAA